MRNLGRQIETKVDDGKCNAKNTDTYNFGTPKSCTSLKD